MRPPSLDANGWYEITLVVNKQPQHALLELRAGAAQLRFLGEERVFELHDVHASAGGLEFVLPMNRPYPVRLAFDGLRGTGRGGDAARGGAAEAMKVRQVVAGSRHSATGPTIEPGRR